MYRSQNGQILLFSEAVMRGVVGRCDQKSALSAGKRPFSRASFQSEGTAERRGLHRHAIRRSAVGSGPQISRNLGGFELGNSAGLQQNCIPPRATVRRHCESIGYMPECDVPEPKRAPSRGLPDRLSGIDRCHQTGGEQSEKMRLPNIMRALYQVT